MFQSPSLLYSPLCPYVPLYVLQVDDIESKLDQLIDLYMEDRKRLLALPPLGSAPFPVTPTSSAPMPGSPDSCSSGPTTSFTPISSSSTVVPSSSLTVSTSGSRHPSESLSAHINSHYGLISSKYQSHQLKSTHAISRCLFFLYILLLIFSLFQVPVTCCSSTLPITFSLISLQSELF